MARTKKRRKVAATQATIQTRPPFLKLAFSSGLALVLFIAMGASAQNLLKGNVTKQNETKPNKDLVDKYGDAANDPAVADVLRKAQGSLTTEEIKQKNEAYDALQYGEFKPGADPMMAVMSGYVPPNMSPQQAQILSRVLPKMPRMPHPLTPDDIARMAGETDNQRTALEPSEPYIPYPESFAKAHGLPTSRKLQRIPQQMFPGQMAGRPGLPNIPGIPQMGFGSGTGNGNGNGIGLSSEEIRAQNQRLAEECIRARYGPVSIPILQPGHNAIAEQARKNAASQHVAESDHQSVVGLVDNNGNEITGISYDPYGQPTVLHGGTVMPAFMYKGMYYHDRSGKYLTLNRVYDPSLGRWLSRDPLGEAAGTNLYAYCNNDPINNFDPFGLDTLVIFSGRQGFIQNGAPNPFGHVAGAVPGSGIYSTGTEYKRGSSVQAYLQSQSQRRNLVIYKLRTTPAQEAAIQKAWNKFPQDITNPLSFASDNCSSRTESGLKAGNVPMLPDPDPTPKVLMERLDPMVKAGQVDVINIPQGGTVPDVFQGFENPNYK